MGAEAQGVIWITADGQEPANLPQSFEEDRTRFLECCSESQVAECAQRMMERHGPIAAAVIDSNVGTPLRVARRLYQLTPLTHILFLVGQERLAAFRAQMSPAPMIGTHWTIVDPEFPKLLPALEMALKSSHQRRHLRTSLDAINLRLGSERPPPDSSEYRKLVISDKYLATILEHAQDAIISVDSSGRIATWNRGASTLFGRSLTTLGTVRLEDLVVAEQRQAVKRWLDASAAGTPVVQKEVECRRSDARTFIAEVTFAPIRDDLNDVIAVSITARDITERKRDEEELRKIRAELEERVARRTAALHAVNRELEAFTYSASHDLRAPLRGIDGFSQALLEDYATALDENASSYIERIRSAAKRMSEIIDALLMLSRISQANLRVETVDVSRISREILEQLHELEPNREVRIQVESGLSVRADRRLLRIAMENLLGNAWKFTRERDRAVIEVSGVAEYEDPTFCIRDNGAGFDMAYAEKLFLPFQRLHHPLQFEGSGIGLGTVQRVITRHGGRVWASGVPDGGATFYVSLPKEPVTEEFG